MRIVLSPDPPFGILLLLHSQQFSLCASQEQYDEADRLHLKSIEIRKKALGSDHPQFALGLNNRASLLKSQVGIGTCVVVKIIVSVVTTWESQAR